MEDKKKYDQNFSYEKTVLNEKTNIQFVGRQGEKGGYKLLNNALMTCF